MSSYSSDDLWTSKKFGCTEQQAKNRYFSPLEAWTIASFQNEHDLSIDKMTDDEMHLLLKKLELEQEPNMTTTALRLILGKERRKSVGQIGDAPYLNRNRKRRGRKTSDNQLSSKSLSFRNGVWVEYLDIDLLLVDQKYQRALKNNVKQQNRRNHWDWRACGALSVSHRGDDGKYYIVDGFQRYNDLLHMNAEIVLCIVFNCIDAEDEASLFVKCNLDRTNLTSLEKFWGAIVAGSKPHKAVLRAIEAVGMCVHNPTHPNDCSGYRVKNVSRWLDAYECGVLADLAEVVSDSVTHDNKNHLLSAFFVGGLMHLLKVKRNQVDVARLKAVLHRMDYEATALAAKSLNNKGKSIGLGGGGTRYFADAICSQYDKGLAKSKKLSYSSISSAE